MLSVGKILSDLYERSVHNSVTYGLLDSAYIFALPGNGGPKNFQGVLTVKEVSSMNGKHISGYSNASLACHAHLKIPIYAKVANVLYKDLS